MQGVRDVKFRDGICLSNVYQHCQPAMLRAFIEARGLTADGGKGESYIEYDEWYVCVCVCVFVL
jgi:hypothetical protein